MSLCFRTLWGNGRTWQNFQRQNYRKIKSRTLTFTRDGWNRNDEFGLETVENKGVKILVGLPDTDKLVMVIQVNIVVVENEENMAAGIEVVVLKDTTIRKMEQPGGNWRTWKSCEDSQWHLALLPQSWTSGSSRPREQRSRPRRVQPWELSRYSKEP